MSKILVVDDDARNIFALAATLKSKGYTCITVQDGRDVMNILANDGSIELVLMDIMMPETDGYELIGRIRNNTQLEHLRLIAVTAQAMPGDKEKCIEAGADDYISKPIDVDKLVAIIKRHLN